ncbi:prevent-host-death protein [Nocardia sp. NEAU-G5]|uniref:Prevent-host-death protein n=1 Tax=Nocardia albiluteola TaxID=2842303 RepID=A0ABS6B7N0_9NOCA|nr:prevent-host-death protein [Nocardia albiluteola]MBU3066335.1 prevent-host-death protein [Nocardia albiluteola]
MGSDMTVTHDGEGSELVPRRRRRFVHREDFAAMSDNAPTVNLEAFRADQDVAIDNASTSPWDR